MKSCGIAFSALLDTYQGNATPDTVAQVQKHLAQGCSTCLSAMRKIERSLDVLQEAERIQVPESVLTRAHSIFRERFKPAERVSIFAWLTFDSRSALSLQGARGAETASFQRIYRTETYRIEIWEEPEETAASYLIGQIVRLEDEASVRPEQVTLISPAGDSYKGHQDGDEFHLTSIPRGMYDLTVDLSGEQVVLSEMVVGRS